MDEAQEKEVEEAQEEEVEEAQEEEAAEEGLEDEEKGGNSGQMSSPNIDEEFGELLEGGTLSQGGDEGEEGDIDIEDLEREWS